MTENIDINSVENEQSLTKTHYSNNILDEYDIDHIYNKELYSQKKVLLVGAGGIGCELLKSLIMTGFKNISIVDMDKIEKSNLNRQFLFNKSSIGKYKSEMAKEAILKFRK